MGYCRALGTEPYICLNMGTGTLDEALAWVEYCNGAGDTDWAQLRRGNGHAEPYGVRYWGLGNEMYGAWQVGAVSAEEYVADRARWARRHDAGPADQAGRLRENGWTDWDRIVIDGLAPQVDYHSMHIYTGSDDYWTDVLLPHQAERAMPLCPRADRAGVVRAEDRAADPDRLRRVERVVPHRRRRRSRSATTSRTRWPWPPT